MGSDTFLTVQKFIKKHKKLTGSQEEEETL